MKLAGKSLVLSSVIAVVGIAPAVADAAKPGQSMTHIKTVAGVSALLENSNVILYLQGGATSAIMGDSIASADGRYVFHMPQTAKKSTLEHLGSNIVFFNTANNKQVQLRNPSINLSTGDVTATITQAENKALKVFIISNLSDLKAKITDDKSAKTRATAYVGANLVLAPGVAQSLNTLLELPVGTIAEGLNFATADLTIIGKLAKR
jgi:hypothetical protein